MTQDTGLNQSVESVISQIQYVGSVHKLSPQLDTACGVGPQPNLVCALVHSLIQQIGQLHTTHPAHTSCVSLY